MFGLDFWEIAIILVVVLIFTNPKDLPKVVRLVGRMVGELRNLRDRVVEVAEDMERNIMDQSGEEEGPQPKKSTRSDTNGEKKEIAEATKIDPSVFKRDTNIKA